LPGIEIPPNARSREGGFVDSEIVSPDEPVSGRHSSAEAACP
jgi:hypothetical protein